MARVYPDGWRDAPAGGSGAAARRIETLKRFSAALPDGYTVYHAVHWSTLEDDQSVYGELDFAIVNRAGDLLLVEQVIGFLDETPHGLVQKTASRTRSISAPIARTVQALSTKLRARLAGREPGRLEYLLYCPDHRIRQPASAGLAPERVVDATRRDELIRIVRAILPESEDDPRAPLVHRFLRDLIQLETDVSALVGRARALVTRISGGLALWARQLEFEPWRLRVTATAGSGKTQLALAEYRGAIDAGRRPLYVCYNRPLADHFAAIAPPGGLACTFHQLCDLRLRAAGRTPDFSGPDPFERLVAEAAGLPAGDDFRFDSVIVDEGQDFSDAWRDQVLPLAAPGGRLLWLEDPLQNLYGRPPVALPGWVVLRAQTNYRSPRAVVRMLRAILPDAPIEAGSPLDASDIEFLVYRDPAQMRERAKEAVRLCFSAGFRRDEVVILTYRGRDHSELLHTERLGANLLRRFTGRYDLLGQPVFTPGDLLAESVYRFKGQAAPAVIFAEIDFDALDEAAARKLFVGATRAMMKLVLVISERSAAALRARLHAD